MKKTILTIIAVVTLITATTAYGAVLKKKQEIYQNDNVATIYQGSKEIYVYKVIDGTTNCYVTAYNNYASSLAISCVK